VQFLRHIERTRLLAHLVDVSDATGREPAHDFETVMAELASFSEDLAAKPMIVVATKMDAAQDPARVESLRRVAAERGLAFFEISSVTGQGLDELRYAMAERVLPIPKKSASCRRACCCRISPACRAWWTWPPCATPWPPWARPQPRQSAAARRPGDRPLRAGGQFRHARTLRSQRALEFQRNRERYMLLRWGQTAFRNFPRVPPDTGIVHQVNLEYLAPVVFRANGQAYPDSVVGTDSHTTMVNGLGVLGWGVGGIEAEACMLGQPVSMLLPPVIGFKLHGKLREGCTATDLVLTITQILRKKGVVGKFVEFYGTGLSALSLADRATVANMAPEYGATMGFFPVDRETLSYLKFSNRDAGPDRAGGSLYQGAGPVPHRRDARPGLCRHARARPRRR
jgi:hypothetical protein